MKKYIVVGGGIAGISAAYHLKKKGIKATIFEKENEIGGLCNSFQLGDFTFDYAPHLSFAKDEYVKELFASSCEIVAHKPPRISNYYHGTWVKHPAQNNLYPLSSDEKVKIIADFVENPYKEKEIKTYEDWLKASYGEYFTEHFSKPYTRKYWVLEAKEMNANWVSARFYTPNITEVLKGAFEKETPNTYYADEMRVPKYGGYKSFLNSMLKEVDDIRLNKELVSIDTKQKKLYFKDKSVESYDVLISTLPLPEYAQILKDIPTKVKEACLKLKNTSMALISLCFNKPQVIKDIWFYIYDEDILAARCYSPSQKSPFNAPKNCSSLQFEVCFSKDKPLSLDGDELVKHIVQKGEEMGLFTESEILQKDIRVKPYANVSFYLGMEDDRSLIREYLKEEKIYTAGRFGKWDYLWSDQSLLSGKDVVEKELGF